MLIMHRLPVPAKRTFEPIRQIRRSLHYTGLCHRRFDRAKLPRTAKTTGETLDHPLWLVLGQSAALPSDVPARDAILWSLSVVWARLPAAITAVEEVSISLFPSLPRNL